MDYGVGVLFIGNSYMTVHHDRREIFDKDMNATAVCVASIGGVIFRIQIAQKLKRDFI